MKIIEKMQNNIYMYFLSENISNLFWSYTEDIHVSAVRACADARMRRTDLADVIRQLLAAAPL